MWHVFVQRTSLRGCSFRSRNRTTEKSRCIWLQAQRRASRAPNDNAQTFAVCCGSRLMWQGLRPQHGELLPLLASDVVPCTSRRSDRTTASHSDSSDIGRLASISPNCVHNQNQHCCPVMRDKCCSALLLARRNPTETVCLQIRAGVNVGDRVT